MSPTDPPPPGHVVRAPTVEDAPAIFRLFADRNLAVVGFEDLTLDDMVDELAEPGLDLAADAWFAHDPSGRPSGYGAVYPSSGAPEHHIELLATDAALGRWLLDRIVDRTRAIGAAAGHPDVAVELGVYRSDAAQQELVEGAGLERATTFHRLRIDHDGPGSPTALALPPGIVRHTGDEGLEVRRAGHAVIEAAFAGQNGITPQPFEAWQDALDARSTFTWPQLVVLEADGEPVAARLDNDQFAADEGCGYVHRLAVLEPARGRGLARLLLQDAFATHAAAGRAGTILHVDTDNPTPALDLYTSVGMRPVLVIDLWRGTFAT